MRVYLIQIDSQYSENGNENGNENENENDSALIRHGPNQISPLLGLANGAWALILVLAN